MLVVMLWQHAVGKSAAMSDEGCYADMGTVKAGLPFWRHCGQ